MRDKTSATPGSAGNIPVDVSAVAAVLVSNRGLNGKILLLRRQREDYWSHVSGHIKPGESPAQAILREIKEETGADISELYNADYLDSFYDAGINRIRLVPVFVAYWPGRNEPVLNDEHAACQWCALEKARQLAPYPNQHRVFEHVWRYFISNEPNPSLLVT